MAQSSSVAASRPLAGRRRRERVGAVVGAQSTPASLSAAATAGRKRVRDASCTSSVSAALQTPGRCIFALSTIASACSRSAAAST